ncbi:hypothetical protein B0A48_04609 [Cryoendolithus antarcticus]|uniref:GST C-terminal domain-containing protein n=1 Tax=Cryoendolithus antarcticus TaxID=1507870 RepID=A0A1V8TG74_9PEZI|nr:hypothetical protein B0A48_04609 [Cryoendolithus antarcticus]
MVLKIYLDPCTINCRKVLAGVDLIGTDFELVNIDYFNGGHKDPSFTKINPCATVPAATDGDLVLTESNAIMQYAADIKQGGSSAYPVDPKRRADVNRWLLWEASVWFPSCYVYIVQNVVQELLGGKPDQAALSAEEPNFHKLAKVLEMTLSKQKWIAGDEVTIADLAIAAPMHLWKEQKLPLENYPGVTRWIQEVEKLPCWQKTQGAVEKALLPNKKQSTTGANGSGGSVKATLNYTKDVSPQLTEIYFYETEKSKGIHEPGDSAHEVDIHDGWSRADDFHVDKHGFSLNDFRAKYSKAWDEDETVRREFYPEIVEFLKKTLGAKEVLVFDHTIRTKKNVAKPLTDQKNTSQRAPVQLVHCDYTAESGPKRITQLLPDRAPELLKRRHAFLNVWKPLHAVEENPLAMCDVTSSPPEDFFKLHLRYHDRDGENYLLRYSPEHKWYYFPGMDEGKVILLKTFDSEEGVAKFVGHSAFADPTSKSDARPRESIEIRTIAFF